jgi:hypothetical protein
MTDQAKDCLHCGTSIPKTASVSFQCRKSQNQFLAKLELAAFITPIISIALSIFLVGLSWMQFREAVKKTHLADTVVQSAQSAERQAAVAKEEASKSSIQAADASKEAKQARDESRDAVEHLRTNVKLLLEMDHLTPKLVLSPYDPVRVGRVRQKLEQFAVPDDEQRKIWLKSLK